MHHIVEWRSVSIYLQSIHNEQRVWSFFFFCWKVYHDNFEYFMNDNSVGQSMIFTQTIDIFFLWKLMSTSTLHITLDFSLSPS